MEKIFEIFQTTIQFIVVFLSFVKHFFFSIRFLQRCIVNFPWTQNEPFYNKLLNDEGILFLSLSLFLSFSLEEKTSSSQKSFFSTLSTRGPWGRQWLPCSAVLCVIIGQRTQWNEGTGSRCVMFARTFVCPALVRAFIQLSYIYIYIPLYKLAMFDQVNNSRENNLNHNFIEKKNKYFSVFFFFFWRKLISILGIFLILLKRRRTQIKLI